MKKKNNTPSTQKEVAWQLGDAEKLNASPKKILNKALSFWEAVDDPLDILNLLWLSPTDKIIGWDLNKFLQWIDTPIEIPLSGTWFIDIDNTIAQWPNTPNNQPPPLSESLLLSLKPIKKAIDAIEILHSMGAWIIFLTARNQRWHNTTQQWLQKHLPNNIKWELITKPSGESRPDHIWKAHILSTTQEKALPIVFVDDDPLNRNEAINSLKNYILVFSPNDVWNKI